MAATAGTMTFVGLKTGRTYSIDMYIPDAVNTYIGFNPNGGAVSTSPTNFRLAEDVKLIDISIGSAPTAVGMVLQGDSANVLGGSFRWANQLQTLANRQKLEIGIKQGTIISAVQF